MASTKTKTSKSKAAAVGSLWDLKADVASVSETITRNKAAGVNATVGSRRPDKKPTIWARTNRGVNERAARDVIELDPVDKRRQDIGDAQLKRKAKLYEKLKRGDTAGMTEKQREILLVDFDAKEYYTDSSEDDVDESTTIPKPPGMEEEDDPLIEYLDDMGRIRTQRKSEIPPELLPDPENDAVTDYQDEWGNWQNARRSLIPKHLLPPEEEDPDVIYNPVNHFPVYEPSTDRVAGIEKEYAEDNSPLNLHYDASKEVRAKGAAFYQFSGDDETRKRQMEELRSAREETGQVRQEAGAVNVKPGEVEGMQGQGLKGKALEKRKRELEERRRLVDAKKRKLKGGDEAKEEPQASLSTQPYTVAVQPKSARVDPFAAVEASTATGSKTNIADDFLMQLEKDIRSGRR